jgi:hypothetical protein
MMALVAEGVKVLDMAGNEVAFKGDMVLKTRTGALYGLGKGGALIRKDRDRRSPKERKAARRKVREILG